MKKLYVIILFLVFFNVFSFMFGFFHIFPSTYAGGEYGELNATGENLTAARQLVYNISGADFGDILKILFVGTSDQAILVTMLFIGGAALLAYLTHSPAPFVVALVANVFLKTYENSATVLYNYPIDSYLMLIGTIGMLFLFVITCAEYLTHGDV